MDHFYAQSQEQKTQAFQETISDFSTEVQRAFLEFNDVGYFPENCVTATDHTITFDLSGIWYDQKLILTTDHPYSFDEYEYFLAGETKLRKTDGGYILSFSGEPKDPTDDSENAETAKQVDIFFTNANIETKIYRIDCPVYDSPWFFLYLFADQIIAKKLLGEQYLNEKEKALLPLLTDIDAMWFYHSDNDPQCDFSTVIPLFEKHGLKSVIKALNQVRKKSSTLKIGHFHQVLNRPETEPLWREIYEKILDSQKDYPDREAEYKKHDLAKIRSRIERKMHELGYEGSYPEFYKTGAIKGLHLISNYDMSYWVGNSKNTKHFIKCLEDIGQQYFHITFLCGTALQEKDKTAKDVFECTFNRNGKRFFHTVDWSDDAMGSLEHFVSIAAKKSECKKLSNTEKALQNKPVSVWTILLFLLFFGLFFAIGFTVLFFLFVCVLEVSITRSCTFSEMFFTYPWGPIFLFCFLGFGGAMAIIETLAKRK